VFKPSWDTHPAGNTDWVTASQTVYRNERRSLEGRALLSIFSGSRGILAAVKNNRSAEGHARWFKSVGWFVIEGALFHGTR
jgi:hypothetical protein